LHHHFFALRLFLLELEIFNLVLGCLDDNIAGVIESFATGAAAI